MVRKNQSRWFRGLKRACGWWNTADQDRMGPAEVKYLAARLGEIRPEEPVLELGAGWDAEFHRTPFRTAGYTHFLTQDIAEYNDA
jgi:hypothetical protein